MHRNTVLGKHVKYFVFISQVYNSEGQNGEKPFFLLFWAVIFLQWKFPAL